MHLEQAFSLSSSFFFCVLLQHADSFLLLMSSIHSFLKFFFYCITSNICNSPAWFSLWIVVYAESGFMSGCCRQRLPKNDSIGTKREHTASVQHMVLGFLTLCIVLLFLSMGPEIQWSCMCVCVCVCNFWSCVVLLCYSWNREKVLRS